MVLFALPPSGQRVAQAAVGEKSHLCQIDGPTDLKVGDTALYTWRVRDNDEDIYEDLEPIAQIPNWNPFPQDEWIVSVDNVEGSSKITRVLREYKERQNPKSPQDLFKWVHAGDLRTVGPTNMVVNAVVVNPTTVYNDMWAYLKKDWGFQIQGNPCGTSTQQIVLACIIDRTTEGDYEHGFCPTFGNNSTLEQRDAWAIAMDTAMKSGQVDCQELTDVGRDALLRANYRDEDGILEISGYWLSVCDFTVPRLVGPILDDFGMVTVTCYEAGNFGLTFTDSDQPDDTYTLDVTCRGGPTDNSSVLVFPQILDMIPSPGNISHAMVMLDMRDKNNNVPFSGVEVNFTIDRCAIETSGVDTPDELINASQIFAAFNPNVLSTIDAIESSDAAKTRPDTQNQSDSNKTMDVGNPVLSRTAAIINCNINDVPDVTPGIATIIVTFTPPGGPQYVKTAQILVIGPPDHFAMTATPATIRCGEKTTIVVDVRDKNDRAVSNQTRIEATTNFGGVYAGTGAVANQAGLVTPLSSTVSETFEGISTFYLLTSTEHVGPYVVQVTAGASGALGDKLTGSFASPPINASVTINCFVEEPAGTGGPPQMVLDAVAGPQAQTQAPNQPQANVPAQAGPRAITPPNTGDAGLVSGDAGPPVPVLASFVACLAGVLVLRTARPR